MTYRGPWNAASLRHRQAPRKYVKVGPVGDHLHENAHQSETCFITTPKCADYAACKGCGHHVCSCPPKSTEIKREARITTIAGGSFTVDSVPFASLYAAALLQKPLPMVHVPPPEDPLVSAEWVARQHQLQADMQPEVSSGGSVDWLKDDGRARVTIGGKAYQRSASGSIYMISGGCAFAVTDEERESVQRLIDIAVPHSPFTHLNWRSREPTDCASGTHYRYCDKCNSRTVVDSGFRCITCQRLCDQNDTSKVMLEGSPLRVGDRLMHPDTGEKVYVVKELRGWQGVRFSGVGYCVQVDGYYRVRECSGVHHDQPL